MASFRADRRLFVTADRERVVEEGDPDAAFLLAGVNRIIGPEAIERYGLEQADDGTVVIPGDEPEEKLGAQPEDKMAGSSEDKSASGPEAEVEQSGSWFTIYVDGEEVDKVQGQDALDTALEEWG